MRQINSSYVRLILVIIGIGILSPSRSQTSSISTTPILSDKSVIDLKMKAYDVLKHKCNICHQKKNPRKVFTLENMSYLSSKIQKQVFIKRRMPKGNQIYLTNNESAILKKWLLTQKLYQ